ncbi:MAG: TIR domain-containing protein [Nitrospira sp.]|nr:TIR domain-containing protein [Nitrospira sp.]
MQIARSLIAEEREKQTGFLDLGNLGLTEIPVELFELTHLRKLNLGSWYPDKDGKYQESRNGDRNSSNSLDVLPSTFGALPSLLMLSLAGNPITDLSPLAACSGLQQLDCSSTQVTDLSPLAACSGLQQLNCAGTQVTDLSPVQSLTTLQQLNCARTQVTDLSPVQSLTALQQLNCAGTQVTDLSPVQSLTTLQQLNCSRTQVTDLSPVQSLTTLQQLDCAYTQVTDLSPVQSLTTLQQLDCAGTQVTDLSPVQSLTALQQLDCAYTQVTDLSPVQSLTTLQQLNCAGTQVTDLSPLISILSLQRITGSGCHLKDFPRRLLFRENLQELILHETTIPGIPAEVLSASPFSSCLEELRAHLVDVESGSEEIHEAKLVVLGNGRVGKTQICRRLRGLPYDDTVASTHGITVTAEPWGDSTNEEVLNIWDFGGQDIYHGAHTLFMKTSAIFLIAWHPDFETTGEQSADGIWFRNYPLPYWLEYVRTLGRKDCPVIVVQARCDRPEQEVRRLPVDDTFLTFSSLKPCWYSARKNRGQGALNDALQDAIEYLRSRDGIVTIGVGRAKVLRRLEAWRNEDLTHPPTERLYRTLSQEEFHSLCEQAGGIRSPEHLLTYLHNLGVVFYQPDLFKNRIILDQSWALDAVYAVLDRQKAYPLILSQRGRFSQSLLAITAWRDYSDSEQRLFLSLMESCGIIFVHREAEPKLELPTEYLAPDLLPRREAVADQLAGRWSDHDRSWRLEYDYPFLHPGLMRALLCDIGSRSKEAGVYWKYGVWLYEQSTGCRALLEQQMHDERRGKIVLTVQGHRHQELVRWLCERIEERNRLFGYPQLKPVVDDFGMAPIAAERTHAERVVRHKPSSLQERISGESSVESSAPRVAQEPSFAKPPVPSPEPQIFISYAWGDDTPAGRQRGKVTDDLCAPLGQQGIKIHRDRDEMRPGDLISEFMDRLAEGDFVIVVMSDKYLRSEYCMYELFRIYRNCADKPDRFLKKVIPIILPDSRIDSTDDRLERAIYWTNEEAKLKRRVKKNIEAVGPKLYTKFRSMGEFARHTSDMLEYLVDKLQPRDFDRQAKEGFKEVVEQITQGRSKSVR